METHGGNFCDFNIKGRPQHVAVMHTRHLHNLQYQTSFVRLVGQQRDRGGDVAAVHADHVGMLVVPEVGHLLCALVPRVPDHRVREVVLLDPHLAPRHHVRHDMLVRRVDVNPENVVIGWRSCITITMCVLVWDQLSCLYDKNIHVRKP